MKWGLRWGDPWGRTADADSPLLAVTECVPVPAYGPGAYRISWTWSGGSRWGYRWGRRWGRAPVWFKVYVNSQLVETTKLTNAIVNLPEAEDPKIQVVVVGPLNGDAEYDPSIALEVIPGNRARVAWSPPDPLPADLDHYRIFYDAGGGSVDWNTPIAKVREDGSSSYAWISAPLADGTYKFGVRSVDAAGNVDSNTTTQQVVIASWPAAPTGLAYSYDPDTDKVTLSWTCSDDCNIYGNGGTGEIDYTTPIASGQSSPWLSGALTGPGTFRYGVRADNGSYEEKNLVYIEFELDSDEDEVNYPNAPTGIEAVPAAGGTFSLTAWLDPRRPTVLGRTPPAAASVQVYHDNGTGTMDWNNSLGAATMTLGPNGQIRLSYTSGAYSHGAVVQFGMRARAASGAESENTDTGSATADSQAPSAPESLAVTAVGGTESDR